MLYLAQCAFDAVVYKELIFFLVGVSSSLVLWNDIVVMFPLELTQNSDYLSLRVNRRQKTEPIDDDAAPAPAAAHKPTKMLMRIK